MTELREQLSRLLHARFPGFEDTGSARRQEWAEAVAVKAFPALRRPLRYLFIRSARRHCEKFEVAGQGGIIMDDGLSNLLAVGDLLLADRAYVDDAGVAYAAIQLAEAFHYEADAERCLIAAAAAQRHRLVIDLMRRRAAGMPGRSAAMLFLLLHEIAHFAVDYRLGFVLPRIADVQRMRESLVDENEKLSVRLQSDDPLADLDTSFQPGPSPERATMQAQIRAFTELIRNDDELVREASCDFVALTGLVELRLADSLVDDDKTVSRLTYRELADTLLIALRATRLLVAQEFIRRTAASITAGDDPTTLTPAIARLQARFSIVTNLASESFAGVLQGYKFERQFDPADPARDEDPARLFSRGITLIHERSVERMFDPIDELGRFFRDPEAYEAIARKLLADQFGTAKPAIEDVERFTDGLMANPPF